MITEIKLKNFKVFKEETTFPLSRLNLLTGVNGRGKSSLLQSLLLLRQSVEEEENTNNFTLNGKLINIGTFRDIKNVNNTRDISTDVTLKLLGKNSANAELHFSATQVEDDDKILKIKTAKFLSSLPFYNNRKEYTSKEIDIKYQQHEYQEYWINADKDFPLSKSIGVLQRFFIYNLKQGENIIPVSSVYNHFRRIHYISADRLGPQRFYEKYNLGNFIETGKQGEKTVNVISAKKEDLVNDKLYIGNNAQTLLEQTGEWLSEILDTKNINLDIDDHSNDYIITLDFRIGNELNTFKPTNVGFGYSYILPIIVSGLIAEEGEILIIENPEAHLHPKAQSQLAKFLAKVASCGVQVFVESHSEHILNALRVAIVQEEYEISNEDVSVLYFDNQFEEGKYFEQIEIEKDGRITNWLEGFFDQSEQDLDIIFKSMQ